MRRIIIEMPEETYVRADSRLDVIALLNLIEPGAGGHTLMTHFTDLRVEIKHSRLGVTIISEISE